MRAQSRRTDAFPTTWEIPVGLGLIWLLGAFLAFPAGQGAAYLLTGRGFVWPGPELGTSLVGLLGGEPGHGLPAALAADPPSAVLVYGLAIGFEGALGSFALIGLTWWWRTVGPYAQFGMAPRHEVAAVLGRAHLRSRAKTIRPDLVARGRR